MSKKIRRNRRYRRGFLENIKISKKMVGKEEKIPTMPIVLFEGFIILNRGGKSKDFSFELLYKNQRAIAVCPECGSLELKFKDHYWRKAHLCSKEGKAHKVIIKARRFRCAHCALLFRERIEGLLPFKQLAENFKDDIIERNKDEVTNKRIAKRFGVSESTVERVLHERFEKGISEQINYPCPQVLGIDEHTIHKGYKFATTLCDLKNHRIYDIIKGRSASSIESYLMSLKGRDKVKVVCMDLSSTYRSIARKCFPKAKIVADRFHVIRLVLYHFMEFCKQAQPDIKWKRGITYLLRTHRKNIKGTNVKSRRQRLNELDEFLEKNPAIREAYLFKERLCELLNRKQQNFRESIRNIRELKKLMHIMKYESVKEFEDLAATISDWWTPIIRMWRFVKSNSITEGFHRLMKLIQRKAFGFRNFENYRMRVLVRCGVNLSNNRT